MAKINILGILIDEITRSEAIKKIENFASSDGFHYVVTPNPEIILSAQHDEHLFYALNNAHLSLPDGIGLKFASCLMGKNIKRIAGADLVPDILSLTTKLGLKTAVIHWNQGLSSTHDIEQALHREYPGLEVLAVAADREGNGFDWDKINQFKPRIIFVAFGCPWQEKFMVALKKQLTSPAVAMACGGSFDFLTGRIKRAPKVMCFLGIEWLWRWLFHSKFKVDSKSDISDNNHIKSVERYRRQRIYNAIIRFPIKFLEWRFILPFKYRPNVACLVFKKNSLGNISIFIGEREDEPGHWQLPQGGIEGQTFETAGLREIEEELGTNKVTPIAVFGFLHNYIFDKNLGKYKSDKHFGFKGQKQALLIAQFFGKDEDIKISFTDYQSWKWVAMDQFVDTVHPLRQKSAQIYLDKLKSII